MVSGSGSVIERTGARRAAAVLRAYPELTKIRLTSLVVATTVVGYVMAPRGVAHLAALLPTVLGTALAAAGAMALNQSLEADRDARMRRTMHRPVPAGVITRRHASLFGLCVAAAGLALLAVAANLLTAVLGLAVVAVYTLLYTPLKPRSPLCTLAGAVCGAIPPMMGWTASGAALGFGAWLLAGALFLWQIPHFLALAWVYRDDYERGGFRMLPVVDGSGRATAGMAVLYSLALVPVGVLAALGGMTGWTFAAVALVLGSGLVALSSLLAVRRTEAVARRLFYATLAYLPLLLGFMVADRTASPAGFAMALLAGGR
ncbi:MAG TPA: heme o synthase [Thermoanaerobaculaceae bacterium]|nr:heme o synthase [Thermoanaerobaculaceae bacterium]